jgi:hypothetical protein
LVHARSGELQTPMITILCKCKDWKGSEPGVKRVVWGHCMLVGAGIAQPE